MDKVPQKHAIGQKNKIFQQIYGLEKSILIGDEHFLQKKYRKINHK